ncbi:MAG: LTA synthase family protein [Polyangiales bacterium]
MFRAKNGDSAAPTSLPRLFAGRLHSVRWLIPVVVIWIANHFLRVVCHLCDGGRGSYIAAIIDPFDPRSHLWIELLVVACVSFVFHLVQRSGWWPTVVTTLVFLLFYTTNYLHFLFLNRPPNFASLGEFPEFITILPIYLSVPLCALLLALLVASLMSMRRPRPVVTPIVLALALGVFAAAYFYPAQAVKQMDSLVPFSVIERDRNFYRVGSILSLARAELYDRKTSLALAEQTFGEAKWPFADPKAALASIEERRNIHLVLLESHLDPRDFVGAQFPTAPTDARYRAWREAAPSRGVSPVFGGSTANAEFEVLCGVPAYGFLNPIVFNVLEGGLTPCLPTLLKSIGYHTVASSPISETFFRARDAYQSLGFAEMNFEDEFDMSDLDGWILSASSTLEQALSLAKSAALPEQPVLNYVVSVAGHTPFDLNTERRPAVVELPSHPPWVSGSLNHSYYTSVAMADYVTMIREDDPDAIVIFFSDHVPPQTIQDYRSVNYMGTADAPPELELFRMPLFVFDRGEPVDVGTVPDYLMPEIIINLLSDGAYCAERSCLHQQQYMLRPPYVFDRDRPNEHECTIHDADAHEGCRAASRLDEEFVESFYSLVSQARAPQHATGPAEDRESASALATKD